MPPQVTSGSHLYILSCASEDYSLLNRRFILYRLIHLFLKRYYFSTPVSAVSRDYDRCLSVIYTVFQSLTAESAKDNAVYCADPCACKHGNGKLRYHGHVYGNPVAACHSKRF